MTNPTAPWLQTLIDSLSSPQTSPLGDPLPRFPDEQMQRNTTGLSSEAALNQAYAFYENVQDALGKAGKPLTPDSSVLDFGFGWGRISRVFMKDVRLANIHGIDVDPDFVSLTQSLFDSTQFIACPAFPPTDFAADTFDLVYSYSVFSHLSEKACQAWMSEFHRILKPGGLVAFTTRHETFFDFCEWAKSQPPENSSYIHALGNLFPDLDAARAAYKRGEIVHASSSGVGGGGPRDSSFYGETWIPEHYARNSFGAGFEFVAGYFDGAKYDQACFVLRKA
ncbi:class I SAM-dependent methyltransferase [Pseudoxanthomonas mexicana]